MKMKMFICIILVFSFTSGANAPSQPVDSSRINIDSLIIEQAAKEYIDSVFKVEDKQWDTIAVVVDSLKMERTKKKILGKVDVWGPLLPVRDTLKWWYWKYRDGRINFYKTTKH